MKYPNHTQGPSCAGCNERLKEGSETIQKFFLAIKKENNFVHTSCVHRGETEQNEAFKNKSSKVQWPNSKHNKNPSTAIDIFQINVLGKAIFDPVYCAKVNDLAKKLGFKIRWGGDWNQNGKTEKGENDFVHFEEA